MAAALIISIYISPYWSVIPLLIIINILVVNYANIKIFAYPLLVALLTVSENFSKDLRLVVQVFSFALLAYLFFKKYGLEFNKYPYLPKDLQLFILLLLILMSISAFFSSYSAYGFLLIFQTLLFFLLVLGFYGIMESDQDIKHIILTFIIIAVIYCGYIFWLMIFQGNFLDNFIAGQLIEEETNYLHKSTMGSFLTIISIIVLASIRGQSFKYKILGWLLFSIFVLAIILTNNRSAYLCLVIGILFLLYIMDRSLMYKVMVGGSVVSILLYIIFSNYLELMLRFENVGTGREYLFNSAIRIIEQNFILGVGPGATKFHIYPNLQYMLGSPAEYLIRKNVVGGQIGQAHSFYMFYFADLGVLGFSLAVYLPYVFFSKCWKLLTKIEYVNNWKRNLVIGITSAGVALFVRGLFEPSGILTFGFIKNDLPFWILFIIILHEIKNTSCTTEELEIH